jgi:hypothetical protein
LLLLEEVEEEEVIQPLVLVLGVVLVVLELMFQELHIQQLLHFQYQHHQVLIQFLLVLVEQPEHQALMDLMEQIRL